MGITENSLRMTPSENGVMQAFWNAKKPMTSSQIVEAVQATGQATWKSRSVFVLLNKLMKKELVRVVGYANVGGSIARRFEPTMTKAEYRDLAAEQAPAQHLTGRCGVDRAGDFGNRLGI